MNTKSSWGGRRTPGPGKRVGRPSRHGQPMLQTTIRLPAEWRRSLISEFGSIQAAVESLVEQHLKEDKDDEIYLS